MSKYIELEDAISIVKSVEMFGPFTMKRDIIDGLRMLSLKKGIDISEKLKEEKD